jgi:sortase (surface protein transpeptidase)
MTPNRSDYNRASGGQAQADRSRYATAYTHRPPTLPKRPSIDGFSIVPANQSDYIDSLSAAPVSYSRHRQQQQQQTSDDSGFGASLKSLTERAQRFSGVKAMLPIIVLGLVLIIAITGLSGVGGNRPAEAERWATRSSIEPVSEMSSEISEKRPNNMHEYQVADDLPRFLRIKGMGISTRVRRVGVGTKTELKLPANIYDAGWYESSVKPGEPDAVVLTGHASGPTKPGIFYDLTELQPGDELELETGDGDIYYYYVVKLEAYDKDAPLAPLLATAVPGSPGLNLVTELGHFDQTNNAFEKRLVVYAVQKAVPQNPQATNSAIPTQ